MNNHEWWVFINLTSDISDKNQINQVSITFSYHKSIEVNKKSIFYLYHDPNIHISARSLTYIGYSLWISLNQIITNTNPWKSQENLNSP